MWSFCVYRLHQQCHGTCTTSARHNGRYYDGHVNWNQFETWHSEKDYEQSTSAVESSIVSYRKETDEKIASLSSAFEHYKMETDQKIATITASVQQISDMYEEEKRMKEDLDMRVESLVESENHLLHMYRKTSEDLDALAQYGRKNCLLLLGVKEEESEDTTAVFIKQAKDMGY